MNEHGEIPPYVEIARPIVTNYNDNISHKVDNFKVSIKYSGYVKETIFDVNLISTDIVELALYSAYYPFIQQANEVNANRNFNYHLFVTISSNFNVVTNGQQVSINHDKTKKLATYEFKSLSPVFDIPIIASPFLNKKSVERLDSSFPNIDFYYTKQGEKIIGNKVDILKDAYRLFEQRFGGLINTNDNNNEASKYLIYVYSPRDGWGYSRLPLIVVSENSALKKINQTFGKEMDSHGCVHELAHFWWGIADTFSNHDWINETFAEYSAFSFSSEKFGDAYRQEIMKRYFNDINNAKTKDAVINTLSSSPDRYVNWYEKGALILFSIEKRFGKNVVDKFMREMYSKFCLTKNATTEEFFVIAKQNLPTDAYKFLEQALLTTNWNNDLLQIK